MLGVLVSLGTGACLAAPDGDNDAERLELVRQEEAQVFARLDAQDRDLLETVLGGVGHATFFYRYVKLPLFPTLGLGGGGGYGVVTDHRTDRAELMSVRRAEWGWGTLATTETLVIAFRTEAAFEKFRTGDWQFQAGAKATASLEGQGIDASRDSSALDQDVVAVELAETGGGVSATVRVVRFAPH